MLLLLLLLGRRRLLRDRCEARCGADTGSGPAEIDAFVHARSLRVAAARACGRASVRGGIIIVVIRAVYGHGHGRAEPRLADANVLADPDLDALVGERAGERRGLC